MQEKLDIFSYNCPCCGEKLEQKELRAIDAAEEVVLLSFLYHCESCGSYYSTVEEMKRVAAPALETVDGKNFYPKNW